MPGPGYKSGLGYTGSKKAKKRLPKRRKVLGGKSQKQIQKEIRQSRRIARRRDLRARAVATGLPTRSPFGTAIPRTLLRAQLASELQSERELKRRTLKTVKRRNAAGFAKEAAGDVAPYAEAAAMVAPLPALRGAATALKLARGGKAATKSAQAAKVAKAAPKAARPVPRPAPKPKVRPKPSPPRKAPAPARAPKRSLRTVPARTAATMGTTRGGRAVLKTGRGVKKTGKVAVKTATFPIRRPIKTAKYSFAAQAPLAISTGDPVGEAKKVLEGQGVAAKVLGDVGRTVGKVVPTEIGKNIVQDVLDLPANIVPAVYLPVAGLIEKAQGNPERLDALWNDYKEHGLIPALVEGDLDKAINAAKEHPLFVALEARGAQAVVGRTAGAVARHAPSARVRQAGSRERKPLRLPGGLKAEREPYSPDLSVAAIQKLRDKRRAKREGGQKATPRETSRLLNERVDRIVAQEEGARRAGRAAEGGGAMRTLKTGGRFSRKITDTERVGVNLAAQNILRSPETFGKDLANYARILDKSHADLSAQRSVAPTKREKKLIGARIKANRKMRQSVNALALEGRPDAIFAATRPNVEALNKTTAELTELGILAPRQAAQARTMPAALVHLGARYGLSNKTRGEIQSLRTQIKKTTNNSERASLRGKIASLKNREQLLDRDGNPLTPERAEALLREGGAEPAGFVSQAPSARGPGSFYKAMWPDRQTVPKAKRTGKATEEGTFDASFDALLEQRVRGRGVVDAVKGFDRTVREFAVKGMQFKNWRQADEARRNPEAFGLPADMPLVPVRLTPLRVKADEAKRAEEILRELDPEGSTLTTEVGAKLLNDALREGEGPVVLLPTQVTQRLGEHFQSAGSLRKTMQVLSSQFKGVVLPTSPNWMLGNIIDVSMRSALTGTSPWGRNARLGRKVLAELERQNPEMAARARSGLAPGSIYGLAEGTKVHRDARQFQNTKLAPLATALAVLRRSPGPKQLTDAYVKYRDSVFAFNERFIERQSQYAQLGKVARADVRATTNSWHKGLKLGDEAIHDLAKGLLQTPRQIRYAKQIEQTLGQWTGNSPSARAFLVDYAPFAMWTRAASKFVLGTLPAKHPIKTALGTIAYEMTETERDALGLSLFADKPLPPNLQGSIPVGRGMLPPQSLSSFGMFADYQKSLSETILPNIDLDSLRGLDWTGKQLTHEDGTPLDPAERAGAALLNTSEAYIPFLSMIQRVGDQGAVGVVPRSVRPYDEGLVGYLRSLSQSRQINIPVKPKGSSSSSGSGTQWGSSSSSSSGSSRGGMMW